MARRLACAATGAGASACVAAAAATVTSAAARWRAASPGGLDRWTRTNHAGQAVTLLEGPEYVLGAVAGSSLARSRAGLLATAAAGALGALDDLAGDASSKGLRGHLMALRRGQVTTGAVKVVGLFITGVVAAAAHAADHYLAADHHLAVDHHLAADHHLAPAGRRSTGVLDVLVGGAVVAGTANLVNLLDLRPGRAL